MLPGIPLVTAASVKAYVGIESDNDEYDAQIAAALPLVTTWFESYCDRGLAQRSIVDEEHHYDAGTARVYLWSMPVSAVTYVEVDGVAQDVSKFAVNRFMGFIYELGSASVLRRARLVKVSYQGGYAPDSVPVDLGFAYSQAVSARSGASAIASVAASSSAAAAIKSIGLGGGALSVAFETGTVKGGIEGGFSVANVPVEVQEQASILSYYRRLVV